MLTYRSDENFKQLFVKEVVWHRKQDAIVQGSYGQQNGAWHGCAVACSLRSLDKIEGHELKEEYSNHTDFETRGLWPEWLARLEDTIFEKLPIQSAKTWPERLAKAIPVGVDLNPIKWKFSAFLIKENIDRVLTLEISDDLKEQVLSALRSVLNVHNDALETGTWNESAARSAASAARSAASAARSAASAARSAASAAWSAASAAWSAASAARSAARSAASAAWSAESAAWSAAWSAGSAARSAAWSAARSAAFERYSVELLRLLRLAK